ncbi:hypothetical protein V1522DRAFT_417717 [Lipomyces starkeyi]
MLFSRENNSASILSAALSTSMSELGMPTNAAACQTAPKANPLEVKSAPYTSPRENEIVIRNGEVAINPIDC